MKADLNGDAINNLADVNYLLNYIANDSNYPITFIPDYPLP